VIAFSGGIGSFMTAKLVVGAHGPDDVTLLFADTLGEDEDLYRFNDDVAATLGVPVTRVADGRTIWEVFRDDRFLGNARLANCSKFLKQKPSRAWLDANCDPSDTTVYVGIDWTEIHRLPAIRAGHDPYPVEAPLTEPPYYSKTDMMDAARGLGIDPPRLYAQGYVHNNCAGACVRAGQAQWRLLAETNPDLYAYTAAREQELRDHLGKDVAILRDRTGGVSRPMTLLQFADRESFDVDDWGGCGCYVTASSP
jgi:hypothetical protein